MSWASHHRDRRRVLLAGIIALVLSSPIALAQSPKPTPPLAFGPVLTPAAGKDDPNRQLNIFPRTSVPIQVAAYQQQNGEQIIVVSGGVLLTVRSSAGLGLIDIEAEQLVFWTRDDGNKAVNRMQSPTGLQSQEQEFYLSGDVQVRSKSGTQERTMRAEQVYYDVRRNVANAIKADLELRDPKILEPFHLKADELYQLGPKKFQAREAEVFSSRLPSDPGLKLTMREATVTETDIIRKNLFGQPYRDGETGEAQVMPKRLVRGERVFLEVEGYPIFFLPVIQADANEPLGPLQTLSFRQDSIFGTQILTTFNMWSLLRLDPLPNTRWTLQADYLSRRGPALGTDYQYAGKDLAGLNGPFQGLVKMYGIYDDGTDILGGGRGEFEPHEKARGRVLARHMQEIPEWNLTFQGQLSLLSDKNFLEQYYKPEFDNDINQESFLYFKYQRDYFAATALVKPNVRDWVTEDIWLPKVEANALGVSFLDLLTYNVRGQAGYARLHPADQAPYPYEPTDQTGLDTGRFNVNQDLSLPFYLGPVKVVPYGVLDLTFYTDDRNGDSTGRVFGGGGARSSIPFTRTYQNVCSDLFNLNGINHKVVFGSNYFYGRSDQPYTLFPQLDRLNDDSTDQALRDITPRQPSLNPKAGVALATSPIFDPQLYAIRRLVDNRVDTLDNIEVLQADVRQRWQTKRGYPGQQHIVDYVTLDLSGSFFPNPNRDNFGKSAAFLEYDATWNIGDRTAIVSSGLYDPFEDGAQVFTIGAFLNRPDRTNFYVGYRTIDPIDSRALTGAVTYIFSPKYAITGAATYDFGINQSLSNSLVVTRLGSDLTMSFGFTYNAILNNFGFTFELIPNIVATGRQRVTPSAFGTPLFR